MFGKKEENFDTIMAPLQSVETKLTAYVSKQADSISFLNEEKKKIDSNIRTAEFEKARSEQTIIKIGGLFTLNAK